MAHRLLIVSSQCGEDISHGVQRFAECGHVAVPEYGPDAGEQSAALAINFGPLRRHGANQSLRDGEPTCRQFALLGYLPGEPRLRGACEYGTSQGLHSVSHDRSALRRFGRQHPGTVRRSVLATSYFNGLCTLCDTDSILLLQVRVGP